MMHERTEPTMPPDVAAPGIVTGTPPAPPIPPDDPDRQPLAPRVFTLGELIPMRGFMLQVVGVRGNDVAMRIVGLTNKTAKRMRAQEKRTKIVVPR